MIKLLKALKRKIVSFLKRKTLLEKVDELENRVVQLEAQQKKMAKTQKKLLADAEAQKKIVAEAQPPKKEASKKPAGKKTKATAPEGKTKSAGYLKKVALTVEKVMAKNGWTQEEAEAAFWAAEERTGCTPKEYYLYRMYEMTPEEQDTILVASIQKKLQKKFGTNKDFVDMLYDKERTNHFFAEYIRRPWCVNTKVSYEEFAEKFADTKRVIYKPLDGNRGRGVEAFMLDRDTMREVYDVLADYPAGVVEAYVVQHPEMLKLCPSSVNTIRVVTFSSNSAPVTPDGKSMDIAYTALRIGGGSSIVDNFHSGGMVCHIDSQTGKLITEAADMECNVFAEHPATGVKFLGFQIPYYQEAMAMVTEAITKNKLEGYLGWDVAIAEDGPILIEVNDRPGVVLLSTPYAAQKKGMKHVLAKYL